MRAHASDVPDPRSDERAAHHHPDPAHDRLARVGRVARAERPAHQGEDRHRRADVGDPRLRPRAPVHRPRALRPASHAARQARGVVRGGGDRRAVGDRLGRPPGVPTRHFDGGRARRAELADRTDAHGPRQPAVPASSRAYGAGRALPRGSRGELHPGSLAVREMKIAILSRNRRLYSTMRLVEAAEKRGHVVRVIDVLRCYMNIAPHHPEIHYRSEKLEGFDAIIPRIGASVTFYGTAVVRQFEMMGTYSLNESVAITRSRDKLRAHQLLARKGIGMPVT